MDNCDIKRFGTEYYPENSYFPGKGSFVSGVPPLNLDFSPKRPDRTCDIEYKIQAVQ